MSHLQRASWILGTLLLGVSIALIYRRDDAGEGQQRAKRSRKRQQPEVPVETLASELQEAWAPFHHR